MQYFAQVFGKITAGITLACMIAPAQAVTFLTEDNPPFNYAATGKAVGFATEMVTEMAKRAGLPAEIRVLKWEDAYRQAQADEDTCVYSIARLETRKNRCLGVGKIRK